MNENPFYVEPLGGGEGLSLGLASIGQAFTARQKKKEQQLVEDKATDLLQSGTPKEIAEFSLTHPEIGEKLTESIGFRDEATKQNFLETAQKILANPANTEQHLFNRAEMVINAGGDATDTMQEIERYRQDPEGYQETVEKTYSMLDPIGFTSYQKTQAGKEGEAELTSAQKEFQAWQAMPEGPEKDAFARKVNLAEPLKKEAELTTAQKDFQAWQIMPEGPEKDAFADKVGLKASKLERKNLELKITEAQNRIQDRKDAKVEMKALKSIAAKNQLHDIDQVVEIIAKATKSAEEDFTATGITGFVTQVIPTSPSYKLREHIDTLKANLGFDKLMKIKAASTTGGALGQVSERELKFLQATLTALDPNMGDEELLEGLERVQRHYKNWRMSILGQDPYEQVVGFSSKFNTDVTEGDIQETMRGTKVGDRYMTRKEVLKELELK